MRESCVDGPAGTVVRAQREGRGVEQPMRGTSFREGLRSSAYGDYESGANEVLTCSSKALALPFQAFQVSLRAAESESAGADAEATGSNVVGGYEWPFGGELTMRSTEWVSACRTGCARCERVNPETEKEGSIVAATAPRRRSPQSSSSPARYSCPTAIPGGSRNAADCADQRTRSLCDRMKRASQRVRRKKREARRERERLLTSSLTTMVRIRFLHRVLACFV